MCLHACMCVPACVCTCTCVHMPVCMRVHACAHTCACVHSCVCLRVRMCTRVRACVHACTASPGLQAVEIIFLEEGKGCYPRKEDRHVAAAVPGCPEPSRPFPAQGTSPNTLKQRANMSPTGPKSPHDLPASQAQEAPYRLTSPIPICPRLAHVPQTRRPLIPILSLEPLSPPPPRPSCLLPFPPSFFLPLASVCQVPPACLHSALAPTVCGPPRSPRDLSLHSKHLWSGVEERDMNGMVTQL